MLFNRCGSSCDVECLDGSLCQTDKGAVKRSATIDRKNRHVSEWDKVIGQLRQHLFQAHIGPFVHLGPHGEFGGKNMTVWVVRCVAIG